MIHHNLNSKQDWRSYDTKHSWCNSSCYTLNNCSYFTSYKCSQILGVLSGIPGWKVYFSGVLLRVYAESKIAGFFSGRWPLWISQFDGFWYEKRQSITLPSGDILTYYMPRRKIPDISATTLSILTCDRFFIFWILSIRKTMKLLTWLWNAKPNVLLAKANVIDYFYVTAMSSYQTDDFSWFFKSSPRCSRARTTNFTDHLRTSSWVEYDVGRKENTCPLALFNRPDWWIADKQPWHAGVERYSIPRPLDLKAKALPTEQTKH